MKLKSFLFLLLIGLFTVANSMVDGHKEMELYGEFDVENGPRSVVIPSITAQQSDDAIIVNFTKTLGTVDITITSEEGVIVYSTTLGVATATQFTIYTGGFDSGAYLLEFSKTTSKGRIYGEFIIE